VFTESGNLNYWENSLDRKTVIATALETTDYNHPCRARSETAWPKNYFLRSVQVLYQMDKIFQIHINCKLLVQFGIGTRVRTLQNVGRRVARLCQLREDAEALQNRVALLVCDAQIAR